VAAALAADGPAAEAEAALAAWAAAAATAAVVDAGDKHRAQNAKSKHKKGRLVFPFPGINKLTFLLRRCYHCFSPATFLRGMCGSLYLYVPAHSRAHFYGGA
jgi:hypothetical protein